MDLKLLLVTVWYCNYSLHLLYIYPDTMAEEQKQDVPVEDAKPAQTEEGEDKGKNQLRRTLMGENNEVCIAGYMLSSYGNSAGNKVESVLSPVGKPLGKGLEQVGKPVGAILGSVVDGGIMKGGRAAGGIANTGAGGMETKGMNEDWEKVKEEKRKDEEILEPIGGQEQTGDNPLGL